MPPKYRTLIHPRLSDFDLQGILNSRQYLDLVGEARVDQMKRFYMTPMELYIEKGQTFVLRKVEIDFGRPIHYGSSFEIETWVEEMKGPMAKICFRFLNPSNDATYAEGSIKYFLVDLKTKKPCDFPEEYRKVYLGE